MGKIGRTYHRPDTAEAYRNIAAAYRHFRGPSFWGGVDQQVVAFLRHKLMDSILVLLCAAGFVGGLWTFWISV
jgi:hypothetical protein